MITIASDHHRPFAPIDDEGSRVAPEPHFDDWDPTAHAYFIVGIGHVRLGDVVFGGTHQVEGLGRANQRGAESVRLDLHHLFATPSAEPTARAIVPIDQLIEIKRYSTTPFRWAYTKLRGDAAAYRDADGEFDAEPGLVPDYGSDSNRCGCLGADHGGTNEDGFDVGEAMCDACVESWSTDYVVVRHRA